MKVPNSDTHGFNNDNIGSVVQQIGTLTTPILVVYVTNHVFHSFDEIQSWQISHIVCGCCVAFLVASRAAYASYGINQRKKDHAFRAMLLRPFGIASPKKSGKSWMYTIPLVSLAPAIVIGFSANFFLETTYILKCNEIYNSISTMCEDGVCCITSSNRQEWVDFIPKFASSILSAWSVVKSLGYFITVYGNEVSLEGDTTKHVASTSTEAGV